jgi:hypothetical protein
MSLLFTDNPERNLSLVAYEDRVEHRASEIHPALRSDNHIAGPYTCNFSSAAFHYPNDKNTAIRPEEAGQLRFHSLIQVTSCKTYGEDKHTVILLGTLVVGNKRLSLGLSPEVDGADLVIQLTDFNSQLAYCFFDLLLRSGLGVFPELGPYFIYAPH